MLHGPLLNCLSSGYEAINETGHTSCTREHQLYVPCIHSTFLQDTVQSLGPLGPAAFVASMALCECIPFFPTQPLSIGAGLLFGAGSGAVLNLIGLCSASTLAFTLSRTAFRGFAEAVVKAETGGEENGAGKANPVKDQIEKAQQLIENGGPGQQFTAILLLRLTPIVPFSASNYVLGLTPVPYAPFLAATIVGASPNITARHRCHGALLLVSRSASSCCCC